MRNHLALLVASLPLWSAAAVFAAEPVVNSLGMKLVRIEPGQFWMGTGDAPPTTKAEWLSRDGDEALRHKVRISHPLLIGAHEVTNAQYEQFDPDHKLWR